MKKVFIFFGFVLFYSTPILLSQETKLAFYGENHNTSEQCAAATKQATTGYSVMVGTTPNGSNGGSDAIVIALENNSGAKKWQRLVGGAFNDEGTDIFAAADGSILIAGNAQVSENSNCRQAFVAKLSPIGVLEWRKQVNFGTGTRAVSVIELGDGSILLTGNVFDTEGVAKSYFIVTYNSAGTEVSHQVFDDFDQTTSKALPDANTPDGYFLAIMDNPNAVDITTTKARLEKRGANYSPVWGVSYSTPNNHFMFFTDMIDASIDSLLLVGFVLKENRQKDTLLFISKNNGSVLLGGGIGFGFGKIAKIKDGQYAYASGNIHEFIADNIKKTILFQEKKVTTFYTDFLYDGDKAILFSTKDMRDLGETDIVVEKVTLVDAVTPPNVIWTKAFGESRKNADENTLKSIADTEGGKIIIASRFSEIRGNELWLFKLNEAGTTVWETILTNLTTLSADDIRVSMVLNKEGEIVVSILGFGSDYTTTLYMFNNNDGQQTGRIDITPFKDVYLRGSSSQPTDLLLLGKNYLLVYDATEIATGSNGFVRMIISPAGSRIAQFYPVFNAREIRSTMIDTLTGNLIIAGSRNVLNNRVGFMIALDRDGLQIANSAFLFPNHQYTELRDIKKLPNGGFLAVGYTSATGVVYQPYLAFLDENLRKKSEKILSLTTDTTKTRGFAERLLVANGNIWVLTTLSGELCTQKQEINLHRLNTEGVVQQTFKFDAWGDGAADLEAAKSEIFFTLTSYRKSTDVLVGTLKTLCPTLNLNIGSTCNDNDPNTTNDKVQSDCTCKGTSLNSTVVLANCPRDETFIVANATDKIPFDWTAPTATTNCLLGTNTSVQQTSGAASGSSFPVGIHTITYKASDDCGHSTTCSFKITVKTRDVSCVEYYADFTYEQCNPRSWIPYSIKIGSEIMRTENAHFQVKGDGTARLYGSYRDRNWTAVLLNIELSGYTQSSAVIYKNCLTPNFTPNGWSFYTNWTGKMQRGNGPIETISGSKPFQVGIGANTQDLTENGGYGEFKSSTGETGDLVFKLVNPSNCFFVNSTTAAVFSPQARRTTNQILVSWVENTAQAGEYFRVEKLKTGAFESIKTVKTAIGEGNRYYSIYDESPEEGDNIYRIVLVKNDDKKVQSAEVRVIYSNVFEATVYPNPANDELNVLLQEGSESETTFKLYNAMGHQLMEKKTAALKAQEVMPLNVTDLPNGLYLLRISEKGKRDFTKQVIIQK